MVFALEYDLLGLEPRTKLVYSRWVCADPVIDALFRVRQGEQCPFTAQLLYNSPLIGIRVLKLIQNDEWISIGDQLPESVASFEKFGDVVRKQVKAYPSLDVSLP